MVQVNPELLAKPKSNGVAKQNDMRSLITPQRNFILNLFALARKQLEQALTSLIKNEVVNVRLSDEKYFTDIAKKIDELNNSIKNLPKIDMGDSPASINIQTMSEKTVARLADQLEQVKKAVLANKPTKAPAVQQVKILNQQPIQRFPIEEIISALRNVERSIGRLKFEAPKTQEIKFPEMPKSMSIDEGKAIVKALQELGKKIDELPKSYPDVQIPKTVSIDNFPPQKYPLPVTNININPLRGFAKSRNITVTTTPTPLPDEVLAYRRSLVVYNNSSSTLYVGGSDVSATNGMPVPASSYSPAFDAGPRMIIYGVVATGSANVRVLELSNENIGG